MNSTVDSNPGYHWAMGVEYDGGPFRGWQKSPSVVTVQADVEQALSQVANEPVKVITAGRTDAGVHATGQVISFTSSIDRGENAWYRGGNTLTSNAVSFTWAKQVPENFHARFSAVSRRYVYVWQTALYGALSRRYSSSGKPMDVSAMQIAADDLVGKQDFSAFRGAGCQANTAIRKVTSVTIRQQGSFIVLDITANAFLLHMVRNIAGALSEVGLGKLPVTWLKAHLAGKDRRVGPKTAPPQGLYLVHVGYPDLDQGAINWPPILAEVTKY